MHDTAQPPAQRPPAKEKPRWRPSAQGGGTGVGCAGYVAVLVPACATTSDTVIQRPRLSVRPGGTAVRRATPSTAPVLTLCAAGICDPPYRQGALATASPRPGGRLGRKLAVDRRGVEPATGLPRSSRYDTDRAAARWWVRPPIRSTGNQRQVACPPRQPSQLRWPAALARRDQPPTDPRFPGSGSA